MCGDDGYHISVEQHKAGVYVVTVGTVVRVLHVQSADREDVVSDA